MKSSLCLCGYSLRKITKIMEMFAKILKNVIFFIINQDPTLIVSP
jgi:hypothetical protein